MGDTGSMLLGYTMAVTAVLGLVKTAATIALVVPVIALGLPILDTLFAIIRRKMSGVPIFTPDKGHLHHRLLALGHVPEAGRAHHVLCQYRIGNCGYFCSKCQLQNRYLDRSSGPGGDYIFSKTNRNTA